MALPRPTGFDNHDAPNSLQDRLFAEVARIEAGGATLAPGNARALSKNRDTVAVSFGNGLLGLRCESADGQHRMVIPADTATAHLTRKQQAYDSDVRQQCQFGFVLDGSDCDRAGTMLMQGCSTTMV